MRDPRFLVGLVQLSLVCAKVPIIAPSLARCVSSTFEQALPGNAKIERVAQVSTGGTFDEGLGNLPFPSPPFTPTDLPELCSVTINVTSSPSSSYRFGLFLPTDWNGRFLAVGNGGFGGGINWYDMAPGPRYGFASMSTDTGHNSTAEQLEWAYQAPEKRTDWGWRAMHGSTALGKTLIEAYYSQPPSYSYYSGCSTGGRQGLKEIQISPETFDGVLVGAPAWRTSHIHTCAVHFFGLNVPVDDPKHIPLELFLGPYADFVRSQCDGFDNLADGIVSEPGKCVIDFEKIRCGNPEVDSSACLTEAQIQMTKAAYSDYKDPDTGETLCYGMTPGAEAEWYYFFSPVSPYGVDFVRFFLYDDPLWDYQQFNASVIYDAVRLNPGDATADFYDLSAFKARGGKIIMYQGMADAPIPIKLSELFYNRVGAAVDSIHSFFRFFLLPGAAHCIRTPQDAPWAIGGATQAGATGTDQWSVPGFQDAQHDALLALMDWVEKDVPVDQLIATTWPGSTDLAGGVLRQRPICPYPQKAVYKGGDEKLPANWECA